MEIRLNKAPREHHPQEGWHTLDGGKKALVVSQGENFSVTVFDRGEVVPQDMDAIQDVTRRQSWLYFAELCEPGPSKPTLKPLLKPPK